MNAATIERNPAAFEPLYTVADVAKYLQVSNSTVYRLIRSGNLAGIKVGQSLRFTQKSIENMIAASAARNGI